MQSAPLARSCVLSRSALFGALGGLLLPLLLGGCGEPAAAPHRADTDVRSAAFAHEHPYDQDGRARLPVTVPERLPNLIVILIDTLRFDALDRREPGGVTTSMPTVNGIAESGVRAAHAVAPAPWTRPSVASLLTGLYPSEHGLELPRFEQGLDPAIRCYAEVMSATYGYETAAFVPQGEVASQHTVLQGFGTQSWNFTLRQSADVLDPWCRTRNKDRPFFLFLHTMEAHDPYGAHNHGAADDAGATRRPLLATALASSDPWTLTKAYFLSAEARVEMAQQGKRYVQSVLGCMNRRGAEAPDLEALQEIEDGYYEGTRWVDDLLAKSVVHLERRGLLDNTLLVITSDHGEAFGEHGIVGHGRQLDEELIHIPLVMRGPAPFTGGRTLTGPVGLIDVLPTFFDWAGMRLPLHGHGHSLLPAVRGEAGTRPPVVSDGWASPGVLGEATNVRRRSVRSAAWKYEIRYDSAAGTVRESVFDLRSDPLEQRDLADSTGRRPTEPGWDEVFERRVVAAAEHIWTLARQTAATASTTAGLDVGPLETEGAPAPNSTEGGTR